MSRPTSGTAQASGDANTDPANNRIFYPCVGPALHDPHDVPRQPSVNRQLGYSCELAGMSRRHELIAYWIETRVRRTGSDWWYSEDIGCVVVDECITTQGETGPIEMCKMMARRDLVIYSACFDTEADKDELVIFGENGGTYSGTSSPHGVTVLEGNGLEWRTSLDVNSKGWTLCAVNSTEGLAAADFPCKVEYVGPPASPYAGDQNTGLDANLLYLILLLAALAFGAYYFYRRKRTTKEAIRPNGPNVGPV